jgi:hypothetical protein
MPTFGYLSGQPSHPFIQWRTIRPEAANPSLPSLRRARPVRQIVRECFPLPPLAGVSGLDLRLLYVPYLAHDDHQNFNFLFRLRQPRNNCSKFIE